MSLILNNFSGVPEEIIINKKARYMELIYTRTVDSMPCNARLSFEFLRVYSPSAEVVGHGPGQEVVQQGKKNVMIEKVESIGNYAIKIIFSDGHDTGIYSWSYLSKLCSNSVRMWSDYLEALDGVDGSRI